MIGFMDSSRSNTRSFIKVTAIVLILMLAISVLIPAGVNADSDPSPIRVNQIGYLPGAKKIATIVSSSTSPLSWELRKAGGSVAAQGQTHVYGQDQASADHIHHADFSSITEQGTYKLWVSGLGESIQFAIDGDLYPNLPNEAMEYFYFHRMGMDIEAQYLSNSAFAHKALHPGDGSVGCFNNWCGNERLNVKNSWADAGDFGIYPVNQAISAWTLLNLYERYPAVFPDGSLNIPESGNGIPDILDEVLFGSTFMKGVMPSTGLASHKIHGDNWSAFPVTNIDEENSMNRQAQPPSTNATYAVARNLAHLARLIEPYNAAEAAEMWSIAKEAWTRASANPNVLYTSQTPDAPGGGDYDDVRTSDDRYAAAAELYLTAYAFGESNASSYKAAVTSSPHYGEISEFGWQSTAATGTLSLLSAPSDLSASDLQAMKTSVLNQANASLSTLNGEGYPVLLPGNKGYDWGSNSIIANKMIFLGYAYDFSQNLDYLKAMNQAMDYFMGNNAMRLSYITGYGQYYETDTHDRWAWGKYQSGVSYPKGWLSGGPNNTVINDSATPTGMPAAKSYAPKNTAPDAWVSKENTINWNAPLVWISKYMQDHRDPLGGSANPNPNPDPEPNPDPNPGPEGDLAVQYKAGDTNATDNQFKPHFNIVNHGSTAVPLSELSLRYYFTADGNEQMEFNCDWAMVGCSNINGNFVKMSSGKPTADTYLEISFKAAAGSLLPGGQTGDIQTRNHSSSWVNLNESNDYSFDPTNSVYTNWERVTLYHNGILVFGTEP
ncbi:glycoside hydrolase family 9 protein [Paenibacillus bouchesdurhonensis]|uniref:glycoside hydrolase family 9 protein n=1 Tax=Paenibacillus bouchesdurhonensis TaxID=1870990 RepID=UPI0018FF71DA|nr:glycoside hydrolase family 9 protein [Paenibacillus bouchesdurhonensis]